LALALLACAGALSETAFAQEAAGRYFSETGHTLDPRFVPFFDDHGAEAVLGYPITDSFVDPASGWRSQERAKARLVLAAQSGSARVVVRRRS
jgi:hypothetical protein